MKKRTKVFIIILICAVLLVPIPFWYKDGGTVEYKAILYTVTKQHSLSSHGRGYDIGTRVRILFLEVYDDVRFYPDAE